MATVPEAMLVFDDALLGVWYIQLTPTQDFLGGLSRCPDGRIRIAYRFRYYRDDKKFDSADERNWYEFFTRDSEARTLEKFRMLVQLVRAKSGGAFFEVVRGEQSTQEMTDVFMSWPIAHTRPVEPEQ